MIKNVIALATIIGLFSCNGNQEKITKYPNGQIKSSVQLDGNKRRSGESIGYYENGNVEWRANYENDTVDGPSLEYFPNGNIHLKATFKKGKQVEDLFEYFEDNNIKQKTHYQENLRNGEFCYYYHNGNIKLKGIAKNGITQYCTEYDSLGNEIDKQHLMTLQILSRLTTKDSIKIKAIIPGFIANEKKNGDIVCGWIEKYGVPLLGSLPKMTLNFNDSCYYATFPPVREKGQYVIRAHFLADKHFTNRLDSLITIEE